MTDIFAHADEHGYLDEYAVEEYKRRIRQQRGRYCCMYCRWWRPLGRPAWNWLDADAEDVPKLKEDCRDVWHILVEYDGECRCPVHSFALAETRGQQRVAYPTVEACNWCGEFSPRYGVADSGGKPTKVK